MIQTKLNFGRKSETKNDNTKMQKSALIVSWNINGLKSILCKDRFGVKHTKIHKHNSLDTLINQLKPDVICLQEIRCSSSLEYRPYPYTYWNFSSDKKGYAGTMISSKYKPISVTMTLNGVEEKEGRIITAEFDAFYLINVYSPNIGQDRLEYRVKIWDPALKKHVLSLSAKKPVVLVGDLNCIADASLDVISTSASTLDNQCFQSLVQDVKLVDAFRKLHPTDKVSSWVSPYDLTSKQGLRLDYCLTSSSIDISSSNIHCEYSGSDHFPVSVEIKI
jgi:exodeoxyribonuclease-3